MVHEESEGDLEDVDVMVVAPVVGGANPEPIPLHGDTPDVYDCHELLRSINTDMRLSVDVLSET